MGANLAKCRDDEPIEPQTSSTSSAEPCNFLASLSSSQNYTPVLPSSASEVVGCLSLSAANPSSSPSRTGVDLVFVIDTSGSMAGEKIDLVRQTLTFVLTQLTENDRVSLVKFSTSGERLCKLTRMTEAGKKRVGAIVNQLRDEGSTNMIEGLEQGLCVLAARRTFNPSGAVVLLTDGVDDNQWSAKDRALVAIEKIKVPREYSIHTFGYGADHNSEILNAISDAKNGGFYFVEKFDSIAQAFANCLGEVVSVVFDSIQVTLETQPCSVRR
jgi:secreted protein with Ig-like and vWFA domain